MAPHSSTLAWKIPWTEEPGGPQSMGSLRVGHDWATSLSLFTFMHWRRKWQPTPVFLPGESQGRGSLVGCRLWGCTESDTTEVTYQHIVFLNAVPIYNPRVQGFPFLNVLTSICQFSSVTQSCLTLCNPMDSSAPGLPVLHQLPKPAQTHVHWVGDAIQSSYPLSFPSPPAFNLSQHQGLFQWVSSSHQVAKMLELQIQYQSFQCIFRTDFL